ncbi:hypothetical protein NMY22_g1913 [Coprinellus aureogranulatus]|nr:hypothetical protein NMY22_g1913 [Coprinellus aureogranulatus]
MAQLPNFVIIPIFPIFPLVVPQQIQAMPPSEYSIAYDIGFHDNKDDLPLAWNSDPGHVYRQVWDFLLERGFQRDQYSDWTAHCPAQEAWRTMVELALRIQPWHKFNTTVKGLRMARIDDRGVMDVTRHVKLGGTAPAAFTPLFGPVPLSLSAIGRNRANQINVVYNAQVLPQNYPFPLPPIHTRNSAAAADHANWER